MFGTDSLSMPQALEKVPDDGDGSEIHRCGTKQPFEVVCDAELKEILMWSQMSNEKKNGWLEYIGEPAIWGL